MRNIEGDKLAIKATVKTVRFYNPDSFFGILVVNPNGKIDGNEVKELPTEIIVKGNMPEPLVGGEYCIIGKEVMDKKWGRQYDIQSMYSSVLLNEGDKKGQKKYLESLFTEQQIEALYEALEDPYEVLNNKDVRSLVTVKGCGFKTASSWINRFHRELGKSRIYVELAEYDLTPNAVVKLLSYFKSPDLVIEQVKKNPYSLIEIEGFGWKRCDSLAQKAGMDRHCPERVEAFLKWWLRDQAVNGNTYVYANEQLMQAIIEYLGEDIPDEPIIQALENIKSKLWWSEDKSCLGLKGYVNLEAKIAKKLFELKNSKNNFEYGNWEEKIKKKEKEQGWEYTEQQLEGIKAVLENQVVIITGMAGTGKSSVVAGVISVLKKYEFAQCALSGRAAARLTEVTGVEGYTIHRLLGFPLGDESKQKYIFHDEEPLPYDIIILDEISMVGGDLFWHLIRAIKPGTKLIMLGDIGQLESIGCANVANDIIKSGVIKSVILDKIHRQAAASAIITDSIRARNGEQIVSKDFVGTVTKGDLQDLTYDCYSDANNTYFRVLECASTLKEEGFPMEDTQIIVPNKERQTGTWNLNIALQEIYNPSEGKAELIVSYDKNHVSYFRVGDKVINTQNNYKTKTYDGQWDAKNKKEAEDMGEPCPIFNGNLGVIKDINIGRREMIVDFANIGTVLITTNILKNIYLGYAVTVHKCQGSEFKYIIFGLDFMGYSLLSRQLVYTGITRASKHCYVIAQTSALRYAITQNKVVTKQTLLKDFLYKEAHPVL